MAKISTLVGWARRHQPSRATCGAKVWERPKLYPWKDLGAWLDACRGRAVAFYDGESLLRTAPVAPRQPAVVGETKEEEAMTEKQFEEMYRARRERERAEEALLKAVEGAVKAAGEEVVEVLSGEVAEQVAEVRQAVENVRGEILSRLVEIEARVAESSGGGLEQLMGVLEAFDLPEEDRKALAKARAALGTLG